MTKSKKEHLPKSMSGKIVYLEEIKRLFDQIAPAPQYWEQREIYRGGRSVGSHSGMSEDGVDYKGVDPDSLWEGINEQARLGHITAFERAASKIGSVQYLKAREILAVADAISFNGINMEWEPLKGGGRSGSQVQYAGRNSLVKALKAATDYSPAEGKKLVPVNDPLTAKDFRKPRARLS